MKPKGMCRKPVSAAHPLFPFPQISEDKYIPPFFIFSFLVKKPNDAKKVRQPSSSN